MKKKFKNNYIRYLKTTLIIIGVTVGIILLDTLQARIFKHSPIISWKENLEDDDSYVDKGIIIDTYYCTKEQDIVTVNWKFKGSKFTCPIDKVSSDELNGIENVSAEINDISETGATIIITDKNQHPYTYVEWYKIEKEISKIDTFIFHFV